MGWLQSIFGTAPAAHHSMRIQPLGKQLSVAPRQTILDAALQQGVAFPHNCRVGGCATCKCKLVSGKVREMTDKSYLLSADEIREGYVLGCQSVPVTDVTVEVPDLGEGRPAHNVELYAGTIESATCMTNDIVELQVTLDRPIAYTAGQYAAIGVPKVAEVADLRRDFSFASAASSEPGYDPATSRTRTVRFHIRHAHGGRFTDWLFDSVGRGQLVRQRLELEGPFGDFWLRQSANPLLCIAGGTGMAPIKALLEELRHKGLSRDVVFFYGARTQADLYGLDAIERLRRSWLGSFRFVPVLSAEPDASDWQGERGMVTQAALALGEQIAQSDVYMCGPPAMLDAAAQMLGEQGLPRARIYADRFLDASTTSRPQA